MNLVEKMLPQKQALLGFFFEKPKSSLYYSSSQCNESRATVFSMFFLNVLFEFVIAITVPILKNVM